jgi:hypothetical protein
MAEFETQRQPVPRNDGGELDTALAFLTFARECVLKKADGLDDEQLRRQLVPSGTTLLWLVRHLTGCEFFWFDYHLVGADDIDTDFGIVDDVEAQQVLADYRAGIRRSDANIRRVGEPDARMARQVDGESLSLRWVLAHMTSETARHAGHADILREQIDGVTGR